jgi:transcriptional regulator with XRE-family HTH domain
MLPEREKQICGRLRLFREILQIPRTKFALSIGISGERLASYESGRARLRYATFAAIHGRYAMNPIWLSAGQEAPIIEKFSDADFAARIKPRALFSEVFDRFLSQHLLSARSNKAGKDANLKLSADLGNPEVLWRLKTARLNFRIDLDGLAKQLNTGFGSTYSGKKLELVESGKKRLTMREMSLWIHFLKTLGMNEAWLWTGKGEMFLPLGLNMDVSPLEMIDSRAGLINAVRALREQAQSLSAGLRAVEVRLMKDDQAAKPPETPTLKKAAGQK